VSQIWAQRPGRLAAALALILAGAAIPGRGFEHGSSDEQPSSPLPIAKIFIDDSYCSGCNNEKLKRGGLPTATTEVSRVQSL
jgi:hypothetical protein